ncbi:unnamed protein product [Blepharisma stoltei]|uniref:Uncharacterized protein n=1 Tax=Blepharisma stoltei TaxID=1481888 RepID=A0AAU9IFL7_9CILI|nr:unnamed protein product [Blepharisma stoltei]
MTHFFGLSNLKLLWIFYIDTLHNLNKIIKAMFNRYLHKRQSNIEEAKKYQEKYKDKLKEIRERKNSLLTDRFKERLALWEQTSLNEDLYEVIKNGTIPNVSPLSYRFRDELKHSPIPKKVKFRSKSLMREKINDPYNEANFMQTLRKNDKNKIIGPLTFKFSKKPLNEKMSLNSTGVIGNTNAVTPTGQISKSNSKPFISRIKQDTTFFTNFEYISEPYNEFTNIMRKRQKDSELDGDFVIGNKKSSIFPEISSIRSKKYEDTINKTHSKSPRIYRNSLNAFYEVSYTPPSIDEFSGSPNNA